MKRVSALVIFGALAGLFATEARAAGATNEIDVRSVQAGKGTVSVGGKYTVAAGHTAVGIDLLVRPAGGTGGEGGADRARFKRGSFRGSVGVPSGRYDVQAVLTVRDGKGDDHCYFSNVKAVTVK